MAFIKSLRMSIRTLLAPEPVRHADTAEPSYDSRRSTPVHDLPPEILSQIFRFLTESSWRTKETPLFSSALVCRRWRDPAQRALHTHLLLKDRPQVERWLASSARMRFAPQSLYVRSTLGWELGGAFSACPGLEKLAINFPKDTTWNSMRSPELAGLRHLTLICAGALAPGVHTFPFQLHSLEITFHYFVSPIIHTLLSTSSTTLTSLTLGGFFHGDGSPMHVTDPSLFQALSTGLELIAANLLHLSIPLLPFPTSLLPPLNGCKSLRHLSLTSSPRAHKENELYGRNLSLLASSFPLPSAITRLALDIYGRDLPNHLIIALRHPTFAHVTHLDFPVDPTPRLLPLDAELNYGDFVYECSTRGIAVRWAADLP